MSYMLGFEGSCVMLYTAQSELAWCLHRSMTMLALSQKTPLVWRIAVITWSDCCRKERHTWVGRVHKTRACGG